VFGWTEPLPVHVLGHNTGTIKDLLKSKAHPYFGDFSRPSSQGPLDDSITLKGMQLPRRHRSRLTTGHIEDVKPPIEDPWYNLSSVNSMFYLQNTCKQLLRQFEL
jgi:hypothetical protein